jgi:predicted CopG family antitoxin
VKSATVRIPESKTDVLKVIASVEKREMKDILSDLIDDYIERHRETLDLLSKPGWVRAIEQGKMEVAKKVRGKSLDELTD